MDKCTECGKEFIAAPEHIYKIRGVGKQCSYTCWNIAKKRLGKDKPRASIRIKGGAEMTYMKKDEIRALIKELARSQGSYGRLDARLTELQAIAPVEYDRLMTSLEDEHFNDVVDLVLHIES